MEIQFSDKSLWSGPYHRLELLIGSALRQNIDNEIRTIFSDFNNDYSWGMPVHFRGAMYSNDKIVLLLSGNCALLFQLCKLGIESHPLRYLALLIDGLGSSVLGINIDSRAKKQVCLPDDNIDNLVF